MSRKKETGPSGAARKRLKSASAKPQKRTEPKRFRFQTFKQQLNEISIESIRRVGGWKGVSLSSENASWFEEAVEEWRELNCTAHFARFCAQIRPYIGGGLPQVVFHQAELKAALLENLSVEGSLAVTPLSALIAMLARDLATDFGLDMYLESILALTKLIGSTEVIEDIESAVRTMFYLSRVLEKQLVGDLTTTFTTVFRPALLLDKKPKLHVIHILVELWATLGRKILLPASTTSAICEFARKSQGQKQVGAQLLASVTFDGRQPMRFLPKHLKAIIAVVIEQRALPLIETVLEKIFFVDASEVVCKAVIESLATLDNPDTIISIVNRILETDCLEPSILSLIPVPSSTEELMMTSATVVCKFLQKRGIVLPIMLKARPIVFPILSQTSQVAAQSIWTLLNAGKDAFVHVLFSASAIEKIITEIFPSNPVAALTLLDLCKKNGSSQLPSNAPIDYAGLLTSSNDHAAIVLAVRLMDQTLLSSEIMSLAKRLLGDEISKPNPLMLALLDAWTSHGDAVADEELVHLVSGWTGYASVFDLLRKSQAQGETALIAAKRNLLSGDSTIRASALLYLESISFAPSVMENCKKLELESAWVFNSDREKGIHLEALYHQLQQNSTMPVEDAEMVMRQLVGVVLGGFRPIQTGTGRVLTAYVQRFGSLFRQIIQDALSMINEHHCTFSKKLGPPIPSSLFDDMQEYLLASFEESRMYGPNAMTCLFDFLTKHPASMDFVQNDFIALLLQVFTTTSEDVSFSEEFLSKLQTGLGSALAAFAPLKNLSRNPRITEFSALLLDRFLPMGDSSIQSKALEVLLAIEPVSPIWRDHLQGILDTEQRMREHLVELSASAMPLCDDLNLLAILVRVLYGRLVARKGSAAGRTSPKVRRKLILNYVAAWERPAVGTFIDYLCSTVAEAPSTRSVTGFLSLLEPVLSKLGRFTPVGQFANVTDLLLSFALLEDKNVRRLAMQRIYQIWHILIQPGSKEDSILEKVLMDRQTLLWGSVVMPRVSKLDEEYGQVKSSLLDLLELWASQRPVLVLSGLGPMASALGSVHRVKPIVAGQLTAIFESLLASVSLVECDKSLREVLPTLFKSIASRLESLLSAEEAKLSQRLLQLLVNASALLTDIESCSEAIETLVSILFSCDLFKSKRYSKMESMQTAVLRVLVELVPLSKTLDGEKAYREVSTWFGVTSLKSRQSREALAALFSCVATTKGDDETINALAACLVEMSSYDASQVDDEPDWERRTAGFNRVRTIAKDVLPSVVDFWLPLLSWSMHSLCLEGDDIGARNQALFLLEAFLEKSGAIEESSPEWNDLVIGRIYLGIRKGMTGGTEEVRASLMALLARLVVGFPSSKTFGPLTPLLAGGDEEANVLTNLGHIQVHRRTRAARRLGEFYSSNSEGIDRKVVEEVFLPFLRPLAIPSVSPNALPLNALLQTEAIQSIAILTAVLPPKSALTKISMTLKRLKSQAALDIEAQKVPGASKKPSHQVRALLRLVPAMLQRCLQVDKLTDGPATDALLVQLFEAALPLPGSTASPLTLPLAESIGTILSGPQRSDEDRSKHLPKLMAVLCQGLTEKDHGVREACRVSLAKLLSALGPAYLGYALTEMESVLMPLSHQKLRATRGSALIGSNALNSHVYGYSVATLVSSMPEDRLVLSSQVYSTLLRVVLDHGFGPLAREKTRGSTGASGQEWTGRAAEARHQKAYELLGVLVRKSDSVGQLLQKFIGPLAERISDGLEDDLDQVDAAFKALESALLARIIKTDDLREHMVLLHALMNRDEPQTEDQLYGHRFALLSINVLVGLLKDPSNVTKLSGLLDGFVPVLVTKHLSATCKHQSLTCAAIKALTALINAHPTSLATSLPSLAVHVESGVIGRCFEILVKTDAGRWPDLCSSALRLVSTAVRSIPGAKLTDSQTRALLSYTRAHLEESSNGKSTLAFSLLRTLLTRRVLLPELLDLISSIATTMIVSPDASVRSQCRSVYQQFLVEYPLGADKLHEHLASLLKNMAGFEWDTGRQSATLVAGSLVTRLPAAVLSEWSSLLLVNVATRFSPGAESSTQVREALSNLVTSLASRLSSNDLQSAYQESCTLLRKWVQVGKPAVSEAAWIMATPFVAGIKDDSTNLRAFLLEEAHHRVLSEPTEAVLDLMIQIGDVRSAQLVLDGLMLHSSLVIRDKVNKLLVPHLSVLLPSSVDHLSSSWSQQLLQLPGETDPSTSDLLIRCLLASIPHLSDDAKCTLLSEWDRPLRPILAEPGLITKNRVTISSVLKILAGLLSTCPIPNQGVEEEGEFSWLAPLCSIAIRTATSDHLSATQSSLVERALAEQLRTSANELLELIQAVLGPDAYTRLTQSVIQTAAKNKSARKTALSHLAVNDPEAYARRKMGRNAAKKDQRKRQVDRTRERAQKRQRPSPTPEQD